MEKRMAGEMRGSFDDGKNAEGCIEVGDVKGL
jgi:hypothetical protein